MIKQLWQMIPTEGIKLDNLLRLQDQEENSCWPEDFNCNNWKLTSDWEISTDEKGESALSVNAYAEVDFDLNDSTTFPNEIYVDIKYHEKSFETYWNGQEEDGNLIVLLLTESQINELDWNMTNEEKTNLGVREYPNGAIWSGQSKWENQSVSLEAKRPFITKTSLANKWKMGDKMHIDIGFGSGPSDRGNPKNWIYTGWNEINLTSGSKLGVEYAIGITVISLCTIQLF